MLSACFPKTLKTYLNGVCKAKPKIVKSRLCEQLGDNFLIVLPVFASFYFLAKKGKIKAEKTIVLALVLGLLVGNIFNQLSFENSHVLREYRIKGAKI